MEILDLNKLREEKALVSKELTLLLVGKFNWWSKYTTLELAFIVSYMRKNFRIGKTNNITQLIKTGQKGTN